MYCGLIEYLRFFKYIHTHPLNHGARVVGKVSCRLQIVLLEYVDRLRKNGRLADTSSFWQVGKTGIFLAGADFYLVVS